MSRRSLSLKSFVSSSQFTIELNGQKMKSASLYDMTGREVREIEPTELVVSTTGLDAGVYFLKIQLYSQIEVRKVIIQ